MLTGLFKDVSSHLALPTECQKAVTWMENRIFVRTRNNRGDVSCYHSADGKQWTQFD
jgi:hypothetical protein